MTGRLFSYQRFSMSTQADGDSVRRQTKAARDYAKINQLIFQDKTFQDLGVSGWKARKRNGLESLLQAIEHSEIRAGDVVFLENLDRLTRKGFQETNDLIKDIVKTGVILYIQSDGLTLNKASLNDFTSIIRVAIMADLAWKESEKKSQRLLETKGQKRKRAIENNEAQARKLPFWIDYNKEKKGYQFNSYVDIVKRILEMRLAGTSDRKITQLLNDEGITTPRGCKWHESSARKVYRHPAVYGAYQTMKTIRDDPDDHTTARVVNDTLVFNHYPALISKYDYDSLAPKNAKRGAQSNHNHLKRLARCGHCNEALGKRRQKQSGKEYINYFCIGTKLGRAKGCDCPPIKELHKIVFKMTKRLKMLKPSVVKEEQQKTINTIAQKQQALDEVQQAIMGGVNVTALIVTSQALEAEIKALRDSIVIEADEDDYNRLSELEDNPVEWSYLATRLIKQITVKCKTRPKRMGMGKSFGSWYINIQQVNGHQVNLTILGENAQTIDDCRLFFSNTEAIKQLSE